VNYPDPVFGKRRRVEHWGHAEYCGQVAGLNMTGDSKTYDLLSYVWSDIFDLHIEFAGDESERDRVLVRGTVGDTPLTVLYLKDDRLTAYFAINSNSREFPRLQRLIRNRTNLAGKDGALRDRDFDLKTLL
jgi:NADPH-dependent 2,4-dienoyl-CoA reductase/sulfur reductase-like enzyme